MAPTNQVSRTICVLFSISLHIFYAWEIKMQTKGNHLLMIMSISAGAHRYWKQLLSSTYTICFKSINQSIKTTRSFTTFWGCTVLNMLEIHPGPSNVKPEVNHVYRCQGKILILNHCYFRYIINFFYLTDMPINCMMVTCFYYPQEIVGTTVH